MSATARLLALEQFGIKLGLSAMRVLLAGLGNPQQRWPCVHVAGTNGKGSVTAMVDTALRAAGLRVGRYTSPHLVHLEERVVIDGQTIAPAEFERTVRDVFGAVDQLVDLGQLAGMPTFFEVSTAAAFLAFARAGVDVAVVEVGLGGRFDATNVLTPVVGAITTIDFDHERYLGTTLAAIASEKAGIAKAGVPLVVGDVPEEAWAAIASAAHDVGAPIVSARAATHVALRMDGGHAVIRIATPVRTYAEVALGLPGRHQAANALVAVLLIEAFASRTGLDVPPEAVLAGVRDVRWPARLEWLSDRVSGDRVLLDAAHNPSGARVLAEYLADRRARGWTLVTSVMADKDVTGVLGPLLPFVARVIVTRAGTPRAMPPGALAAALAALAGTTLEIVVESDPATALRRARAHGAPVLLAGSIYLVGPLRGVLVTEGFEPA